jgi:hypothetical protein
MADGDNNTMIKLLVAGGAAFAGYKLLYQPWQQQRLLQAEIDKRTAENLKKGMSLSDASTAAVSGACQAVAAFYKIPPDKSGGVCHGIGALATYTTALTIKAGIKAGKAIGHGAAVVGRGIGHAGAVVGHGVATGAKDTAKAVKFISYTAPKKAVTGAAKAVKFVSYTAPKKVTVGAAKAVGKGAKAAVKSISHGFGLWGLGDVGGPAGGPRRSLRASVAAAGRGTRRQAIPNLAMARKRRSLAGLSEGTGAQHQRVRRGTAFYDRHLR